MTASKRIIVLAVVVAIDLASACRTTPNTSEDNSTAVATRNGTVVLISIDGYRSDYFDRHFGGNPRIPPVLAIADEGWLIESTREHFEARTEIPSGMHGYDPRLPSMHGLFIAWGPAIAQGKSLPSFENVHVYELLCYLLGIDPAPNDGSLSAVAPVLAEPVAPNLD